MYKVRILELRNFSELVYVLYFHNDLSVEFKLTNLQLLLFSLAKQITLFATDNAFT